MKMETEITVLVTGTYDELIAALNKHNFKIKEEYDLNDIYMIDRNLDISKLKALDILKECILVRDIVGIKKVLLYKYKKYADNGDILEQGKVECPISDINKAVSFMEAINYKELFRIFDKCIVFANEETELVVQLVKDDYIFIEMESVCEHINKKYDSVDELKEIISKYNLPIDNSNYFVKKAEIILNETINKKGD